MFNNTDHLFSDTNPIDRLVALRAIIDFYKFSGQPEPNVIFVNGPTEFKERTKDLDLEMHSFWDCQDITSFVTKRGTSKHDRMKHFLERIFWEFSKVKGFRSEYLIAEDYMYKEEYEWNKHATAVWDSSYITFNYKGTTFVFDRPLMSSVNDRGFHAVDGPCLVFRDGTEYYGYEGQLMQKEHLLDPANMTINDIHSYSSKHLVIDLVGVDHYLEMLNSWELPSVKGRFSKFFGFNEMIIDEDPNLEKWNRKSRGWMYENKPYQISIENCSINKEHGTKFEGQFSDEIYFFKSDPFESEHYNFLFDKEDQALWNLFDYRGMLRNGCAGGLVIGFKNGEFYMTGKTFSDGSKGGAHLRQEVAPAWFKAKMLRKEPAEYICDDYCVTTTPDGKWHIDQFNKNVRITNNVFGGNQNLPNYYFPLDIKSNTWEGLLEKWAKLSFEWLGVFG